MKKIYFFLVVVIISLPVFAGSNDTIPFVVELDNIAQTYIKAEIPDMMVWPELYNMKAVAVFKNEGTKEYKIGQIYGTGDGCNYYTYFTIYTGISPIGCDWMLVKK